MRLPERVSFYRGEGRKGLALLSASFIEADILVPLQGGRTKLCDIREGDTQSV